MNRLRVARHPVSRCTPLILRTGPILAMAMILLGVGLDAALESDVTEQLLLWNPEHAFLEIQFDVKPMQVSISILVRGDQVVDAGRLDHNVVNVDGNCGLWELELVGLLRGIDLIDETYLHATLVGCDDI